MNDHIQKAKQIISQNIYMSIATSSLEGKPWISPVFFAYDQQYNLYWVSEKTSRHSTLIKENPQVAIVIFDSRAPEGEGDGVYFEAKVQILEDEMEVKGAMEILGSRVVKDEFRVKKVGEVTANGVWRIYKAVPTDISKLAEGEFIDGQYVDRRVKIKL